MNRLIGLLTMLVIAFSGYSQDINGTQADSLRMVLNKSISDTDRLDILFRLAEFYIVKPGVYEEDLDNAAGYLKEIEMINARVKSEDTRSFQILITGLLAKEKKQDMVAKQMTEKAVKTLVSSNNKYYLGRAYFNLSDFYRYSDRMELIEKIRLMELAVQCFAATKYVETYAYSLKHLADLYEINEQRSKALESLKLSLKLYQSIHYARLFGVYILFNRYYFLGGNYKLALDYGLMALKNAEDLQDSSMSYCQINNYLAITLVHLKERERATQYYKTALRVAKKYNENASILMLMNNMVNNYVELEKPQDALELITSIPENLLKPEYEEGYILTSLNYARIYFALKKYQKTQFYCQQLLDQIHVKKPRAQVLNDSYQLLIRFYLETRQYALAEKYHQKIDSLSRKMGDPTRIKENFYLAFRLDTATGSYRSGIANLLQYQHLHDSLFDETSSRQMQELEVEYETKKKDQNIVLLNQKNQIQQSSLERGALVRNFTIGGLALLMVILVLLYQQFRHKQKSNEMISDKNQLLQRLVVEKEWLLKEIHHRVKNNLQIVMSLLISQSEYIENDAALKAIHDSQHRVHAMSLIHQKLYNSENVSSIDMSVYIHDLVTYLCDSFNTGQRIRFEFAIEPLDMDVSQALSLGLILNEAITNSLKYAFPENRDGVIKISLSNTSAHHYVLIISDNGIGLPAHAIHKKPGSLGMNLMAGLSQDLDGSFSIESSKGTTVKISFVHDLNVKRPDLPESSFVTNN